MSSPVADSSESELALDARRILEAEEPDVSEVLALRDLALTRKDVRTEVNDLLSVLPGIKEKAAKRPDVMRVRGLAYFAIGDHRKAVHWLEQAGKDPGIRHFLGRALIASGRYTAAGEVLEEILSKAP